MDGRLRETERLRRLSSWPEERWAEKFQKVEVERVLLGGSSGLDGKREIKSLSVSAGFLLAMAFDSYGGFSTQWS